MRRAPWFASLLAAGFLIPACTPRERAERHEKNAQQNVEDARENMRDAQKEKIKAAAERAEASRARRDDDRDIRDRDVDRHPVSGRDDNGPTPGPSGAAGGAERSETIDKTLREKLGDGWVVERRMGALMAVRKDQTKREKDFTQHLNGGLRDFREHHKDATISFSDGELKIRGRFEECDHAAAAADKLADLEGVNRISVDVSCAAK